MGRYLLGSYWAKLQWAAMGLAALGVATVIGSVVSFLIWFLNTAWNYASLLFATLRGFGGLRRRMRSKRIWIR
eukprot:7550187-Pyramimonas_sp.AAC.1